MRAIEARARLERRLSRAVLLALVLATACTWGHEQSPGTAHWVVFPAEARLGATAAIVIDSNYMPTSTGDAMEHHDLHAGRVRILIEDTPTTTVAAHLRGVFPLHAEAASVLAVDFPGAWIQVALFDLPEASELSIASFPVYREVYVEVDEVVLGVVGLIKIPGSDGEPAGLNGSPLHPLLEENLANRTLLRLRAVREDTGNEGFDPEWEIGGLSLSLRFDPTCLANPQAFAVGEAFAASAGTGAAVPDSGGFDAAPVVLSHPTGFELIDSGQAAPVGGQGPFLDIAFDRIDLVTCTEPLEEYVELHDLIVTDPQGETLLDLTGVLGPDSSRYFLLYAVDPDLPL